jgi:hypothetical protein
MRYAQYQDALAHDRAFQKQYMFPVTLQVSKKKIVTIEADEGIMPTTAEGLSKLRRCCRTGPIPSGPRPIRPTAAAV